jgi:pilus assembly protein CpaF
MGLDFLGKPPNPGVHASRTGARADELRALDLVAPRAWRLVPLDVNGSTQELVLTGRLYADILPEVRHALRDALDGGMRKLLVTAESLLQVDYAGLVLFAELVADLSKIDGAMAFHGLDTRIERMFEITGLRRLLAIEPVREEALARLQSLRTDRVGHDDLQQIRRKISVLSAARVPDDKDDESPRQRLARLAHRPFIEWLTQRGMPNREDAWDDLRADTTALLRQLAREVGIACGPDDCNEIASQFVADLQGMGPLQPLLDDPLISEVMVSGHEDIIVERAGRLEQTDLRFRDDEHLMQIIRRIADRMGRRIDFSNPSLDARLDSGARVHALIPPIALDGPALTIRKWGIQFRRLEDLILSDMVSPEIAYYLGASVKARLNVAIGGPAASGKTTLLNALLAQAPLRERIVTIEEVTELDLSAVHPHVVRLQARPANSEGRGEITIRQLVREALRMRADRIIVGEARGAEMIEVLQAMRCGHDGSMTTIHASSPEDLVERATTIALFANLGLSDAAVRRMVIDGIDVILFVSRFSDGRRRVIRVTEPYRTPHGELAMNDVFVFAHEGYTGDGREYGRVRFVGPSRYDERFRRQGIDVPWDDFSKPAHNQAAEPAP